MRCLTRTPGAQGKEADPLDASKHAHPFSALGSRHGAATFSARADGQPGERDRRACTGNSQPAPSSAAGCGTSMEKINTRRGNEVPKMTLATTPQQIGASNTLLPAHEDQPSSSTDHWQVSRYFPLRPVGSADRWSRASSPHAQPATALNGGRGSGTAVGEAPRERLGSPLGATPRRRRPLHEDRAHASKRPLGLCC